jgi:biotin carboxylase
MTEPRLQQPIGILDEHPTWSNRLIAELTARGLPWEKIDVGAHGFQPAERARAYSVVVNRTSPSSHTRGHAAALFYAHAFLAYVEDLGIPVINPAAAYRYETSKAAQALLFERLRLPYPRTAVLNDPERAGKLAADFRFPVVVKPNVGGSGAGIVRFDTPETLETAARAGALGLGPDGVALVQEFLTPADGGIVRVEVLGGELLYAIKIFREAAASFNLCPADICRPGEAPAADLAACPADAPRLALRVERYEPGPAIAAAAVAIMRAARIDVGGVEYLTDRDGRVHFYDVNATSNFVADAPALLGFDPTARFADSIEGVARRREGPPAGNCENVRPDPILFGWQSR